MFLIETTLTFRPSKLLRKKHFQIKTTFCLKKLHLNNVDFLPIEQTPNKVLQNDVDFSPIEITSNKVRRNDADFSPIDIEQSTSKRRVFFAHRNYLEKVRQKDVEICQYSILNVSM